MAPKFKGKPMVIIEQGETAEKAFNAINDTINNLTTTWYFLTANQIFIEK